VTVKNEQNQVEKDIEIYALVDGAKEPELLGKTDHEGKFVIESLTSEVKKVALYAVKDGKYSFKWNTQTYPALAAIDEMKNILSTPTGDPYKEKAFTWMSSPLTEGKSLIQFARKQDYDRKGVTALETVNGSSSTQVFSGEQDIKNNGIVRVNEVKLEKLQQDTAYIYRVGDGKNWSDFDDFTTLKRKQSFEFAVLGDTQSPSDLTDFNKILGDLNEKDLSFMIHVGDLIDESSKFGQWDGALNSLNQYDKIRTTDFVGTLGNHEYMGDADGSLAKEIFNSPENGPEIDRGGTYSVDYNNMHISVLGYTSERELLEQQLEWLKQDVKNSDKPWKILVTHKPPYFTNPFTADEVILLPQYFSPNQ